MGFSSNHQKDSFKLSCQLAGHSGDVRAVSTAHTPSATSLILSASRDATARLWARKSDSKEPHFLLAETLDGHGGFVNSTAFINQGGNQLYAVTGGQDKIINAFSIQEVSSSDLHISSSPDYSLIGHTDNVCALDVSPNSNYIVSGSWDKTARVWKDWQEVAVLEGHLQAVWAVLAVDEDRVLTASADKLVRLWSISSPKEPIAIFSGHSDAVRGLVRLADGASFASCGNDGTINLYSLTDLKLGGASNQPLRTLSGHTSFVYSLSNLGGTEGELVSSGEDRSVRVWRDGNLHQTITIPAISVWSVATLPNGDVVCGSSDHFVRVFTRADERSASSDELQAYETTISSQALNKTQVGDVKTDSLPGSEALAIPGTKEGQTKMIKKGDLVEAYQWSNASNSWQKIGEVVGGVGGGSKKLYEGKEYDHVFDVDIADGVPPLKLPYNLSENPYAAAQRFLERNDLPSAYVDQVVKFIEKNSESVHIGSNDFVDPYTGASRYTGSSAPSAGSSNPTPAAAAATSSSSWNTGSTSNSGQVGNNVDPFTRTEVKAQSNIIPMKSYLSFKTLNIPAVKSKLLQFNSQVGEELAMNQAELNTLDQILSTLTRGPTSLPLDVSLLERILQKWPISFRFPALDIYRLASCGSCTTLAEDVCVRALSSADWEQSWPVNEEEKKIRDACSMIALRCIANSWNRNDGKSKDGLVRNGELILSTLRGKGPHSHFRNLGKNGRIAFATILLNFSVYLVGSMLPSPLSAPTLELVVDVLSQEEGDGEVVYRSLVALGNLLVAKSATSLPASSIKIAKDLSSNWSRTLKEERIKVVQREVLVKEALVRGV